MIVAVAASQPGLRAPVASHFERCHDFVLVDTETRQWRALPNPAGQAAGSAGARAAAYVAEQAAEVVISADFGPNAAALLKRAGIRMLLARDAAVAAALDACLAGRLAELYTAAWNTHPRARAERT